MTATRTSDPALIRACRSGDREAWNTLVDRYGRLVYSIPRRYGMSEADAEDVVQSVFAILIDRIDALKDDSKMSSWLITITHRECWRVGRRAASLTSEQITRHFEDISAPPERQMIRWEHQHLVRLALEELGGRCQQLLTALFLAGDRPSYERIAEQLGIGVSSIGPTRGRCFRKLAAILARMGVEPPSDDDPE